MEFTLLFSHFHFRYQQLTTTHTATSSSAARTRRCPLNFSPLFNKLFTRLPCTILLINPSPPEPEIREASTILALLSDQMEGVDSSRRRSRRTSLKERLGLKGLGCCGTTWGFSPTTIVTNDDPDTDEEQEEREAVVNTGQEERDSDPGCLDPNPSPNQQHSSGMNLAAALAAERQLREAGSNIMEPASVIDVGNTSVGSTGTPVRVSLMRLLEESTEGGGGGGGEVVITETTGGGVGNDTVCCVCMGRKKGAAFIPCGHTFCRVCSRELWLNRGSCPLCNRSILEILDIF